MIDINCKYLLNYFTNCQLLGFDSESIFVVSEWHTQMCARFLSTQGGAQAT
jgi:hypothetical protein